MKIGNYCYIKNNRGYGIGVLHSFRPNNNVEVEFRDYYKTFNVGNVVSSPNIVDLLKVGDIIKFQELRTRMTNDSTKYYEVYVYDVHNEEELETIKNEITNKRIRLLSVVTKEQFEKKEYRIGEEK